MKRPATALLVLAAGAAFAVPSWLPVPGAPELAIDAASIDVRGSVVSVSVRGSPSTLLQHQAAAGTGAKPVGWHRALVRLQFDCGQRQMRTLGVVGYDRAGQAVHSSAVPSKTMPVPQDGVIEGVYDASCELGRALN